MECYSSDTNSLESNSNYYDEISTEQLLFNHLISIDTLSNHSLQQQQQQKHYNKTRHLGSCVHDEYPSEIFPGLHSLVWLNGKNYSNEKDTLMPTDCIQLEFNTFTDLYIAINANGADEAKTNRPQKWQPSNETLKSEIIEIPREKKPKKVINSRIKIPMSVELSVESSQMLDTLMHRAITHWCCIGFKIAPISLDLIRNWHTAPLTIVYCVASISLVTFIDNHVGKSYIKDAAMQFYAQARKKMDDLFFDTMHPTIIQYYFCLSYTSNLLRLDEQQRTWGALASIALRQQAKDTTKLRERDELSVLCWFRWYYVDAWMCLTLNRECYFPDDAPWLNFEELKRQVVRRASDMDECRYSLFQFAILTRYMRMYIQAMNTRNLFCYSSEGGCIYPSVLYDSITQQVKAWYHHQIRVSPNSNTISPRPSFRPGVDIHLHMCYNAMRLIILFQFLQPSCPPLHHILIDCLETNLNLLLALQHLKEVECDQSTYHHMFFAIHNTAKSIYQYKESGAVNAKLRGYACDQLKMNLTLLRGTQAYINDVFKVRYYAEKIEEQFKIIGISTDWPVDPMAIYKQQTSSSLHVPGTIVFRLEPQLELTY
ncbi:hypothetical protein BDF14DRAFT_1861453 [Spinellus fusiger]|nr:hypothetical protein BDF14DRAFT_1871349 [Spinellus fusiger]KAI7862006.1 hypothetical protein BDF14DRAFT_1861453 [Spinellus fusiger]